MAGWFQSMHRQAEMKEAPSDGTWPFKVYIDGQDLVMFNVRATCFGGNDDPDDKQWDGATASGVSTKNPSTRGVALPRRYTGPKAAQIAALGGSPIPARLPLHTAVQIQVVATGKTLFAPFIDVGPAKKTGNAVDFTLAVAKEISPLATTSNFEARVNIRIPGGAKFVS